MAEFTIKTSAFVNLQLTTSKDNTPLNEKHYAKDMTIAELKNKLELVTGAGLETMKIELFTKDNRLVCVLDNNAAMLGSYPVEENMRLHVTDVFLLRNEFDNLDAVPKYELSEDAYSKRSDTVRQFMIKNKMGQFNEEFHKKKELQEAKEKELTDALVIGSRCKVTAKSGPTRLGTVMFKGPVEGLHGFWAGVKYDEPLGKNDGTFNEKRYFDCPPKYGAFLKAVDVVMGDFPEADLDLDEEI